jgi:hypothetical protein
LSALRAKSLNSSSFSGMVICRYDGVDQSSSDGCDVGKTRTTAII